MGDDMAGRVLGRNWRKGPRNGLGAVAQNWLRMSVSINLATIEPDWRTKSEYLVSRLFYAVILRF